MRGGPPFRRNAALGTALLGEPALPTLHVSGTEFYYAEAGDGPLALFVHGAGLDHHMWEHQLAGLADRRHCVAIDVPGLGLSASARFGWMESSRPLGSSWADVVGHSLGGHHVLALWRDNPPSVRSIALLGVMFSADLPKPLSARPSGRRPWTRPVPVEDQEAVVRSISVPLVVAAGDSDSNTPPHLCQKLAATNPSGTFVVIHGAGHLAPKEQPDAVNDVLANLWARSGPEKA